MRSRLSSHTMFSVSLAVCVTLAMVYLTPLKHIAIIAPSPKDIDPKVFWAEYQLHPQQYLFMDVRGGDVYARSHPRGAVNQPIGTFYDMKDIFPRSGKTIVLTCTTGRLAGVAYGFLQDWGFLNIIRLKGGLTNWITEGLPVDGNDVLAPLPERD